jgi:DNA-binding NarL/FixJ family response regulator
MQTTLAPWPRILILSSNTLSSAAIRQAAERSIAQADVSQARSLRDALAQVDQAPVDLLVAEPTLSDGDIFALFSVGSPVCRRLGRIFIVADDPPLAVVTRLRALPIRGIFDAAVDDLDSLAAALGIVQAGQSYWSPAIMRRIVAKGDLARTHSSVLTAAEQVVFSVLGCGADDRTAAEELGLKVSYIKSVRRRIHAKLGVARVGELIEIAARIGVVRFTSAGPIRIGFPLLVEAWKRQSRRQMMASLA